MPFMKGHAPIRRTLKYLQDGQMILKPSIRIVTVNYNTGQSTSRGLRDFVKWNLPQLQYKNPTIQILTFKNMTPSPFIRLYLRNGGKLLVDAYDKSRPEILDHMIEAYCLQGEQKKEEVPPEEFGLKCLRQCICEVPGQVPCPSWVPVPKHLRGKYIVFKKLKEREAQALAEAENRT